MTAIIVAAVLRPEVTGHNLILRVDTVCWRPRFDEPRWHHPIACLYFRDIGISWHSMGSRK